MSDTIPTKSDASSCRVRVGVRVRPLSAKEQDWGATNVLTTTPCTVELSGRQFTYDTVWDTGTSQTDLYQEISDSYLQSFLDGYNATIMAYGQTGSGKTFTMGSEAHTEFELTESTGLIPRFMTDLFHHLEQRSSKCNTESGEDANLVSSYTLQASFLEVYGEDVHDLLDPDRPSVPLREDSQGGIVCTGLTSRTIANTQQALAVLHEGTLHRTTAATLMNLTSSRSHAVFTITLQKTTTSATTANENNKSSVTSSRFTFVDLAGSERMKKTGAEGERAREGIEINKGLLALGNVINALADDERIQDGKKKIHVPYRQSKLTRLLQDALGGNSRTLFLACVSPSDTNASETLSTLHYANRARNIKNAPKRNLDATTLELQHWQTYATILQAELVKHKFLANIPDMQRAKLGEVDDTLMQQKQVNEYLDQLQLLTQGKLESNGFNQKTMIRRLPMATVNKIAVDNDPSPSQPRSGSVNNHATDPNHSILETFDVAMLEEVNPDEEMAILNQLLELQQRDQEYDNEQKKDHQILKQVEGELAEQEQLLLQLRDSLKVYHTMKTKYESLMAEVQQLEREKAELQEQLEKASANPTLGCTRAIQKEMEKVERNLIRARSETLKHRELCKKAEHEAQKCRLLEQKVADLKLGRATLIKKQKEAAARHREYTESKTREIAALKRKARNNEQQMTKLQSEIHIHKRNLDKRQALCNKLLQQKKQTEAHLMKLLSLRNRELRSKTTKPAQPRGALVSNRDGGKQESNTTGSSDDNASFAPINEEIKSIQFQIDKAVKEAVTYAELKQKFEERFVEYSEAMRSMSAAVKELENKRPGASEESHSDLELLIEETSLKVEITGSALEKIQSQLAALDNDNRGENGLTRDSISHLTRGKSSTVLRTLLAGIMDNLVQAEIERKQLSQTIARKVSVVASLEAEVESLSNTVTYLKKELVQLHSDAKESSDPLFKVHNLEVNKKELEIKLEESEQENILLKLFADDLASSHKDLQLNLCRTKERLALVEVALSQSDGIQIPSEIMLELQKLWDEIGVFPSEREKSRLEMENCLENTCLNKLRDATSMKETIQAEIENLKLEITSLLSALGLQPLKEFGQDNVTLLEQLEELRKQLDQVKPTFQSALERRNKLTTELTNLTLSMGLSKESLEPALLTIVNDTTAISNNADTSVTQEPVDNSDEFLSQCEAAVTRLHLRKSKILTDNSNLQKETNRLVSEMNISAMDLMFLVIHNIKRTGISLPVWWDKECAEAVARAVTTEGGVVRASMSFSKHLQTFYETVSRIAECRRILSDKMRGIIERAQKILLQTVDGEIEANEAYSDFHEALFRLPSLSKERIYACVNEIEALCSGVDSMSQSEVEALTVVWEALNVSAEERSNFWGRIDEYMREIDSQPGGPFDDVVQMAAVDGEEWVLTAVKDCTKDYRQLEMKLFKLERIHSEVEQLKTQQDAKSRILTLDSELRILNSKLNEFEDKKCVKQRLITKKNTSSNLLKEERFRKQMQSKFTSKLDQLLKLLKDWKTNENTNFCHDFLSEDVRMFLKNSDRNEFMHLRTVEYRGSSKRSADSADGADSSAPPPKRVARATRSANTLSSVPQNRTQDKNILTRRPHKREFSPCRHEKPINARQAQKEKIRSPFGLSQNSISSISTPAVKSKRFTLAPFGDILEQALSPEPSKENTDERNFR